MITFLIGVWLALTERRRKREPIDSLINASTEPLLPGEAPGSGFSKDGRYIGK
jgi:hypothetical protein